MKQVVNDTQVEINGSIRSLKYAKGGQGYYLEILERIDDQMRAMLSHHGKVLFVRLDFHLYDYTPDNETYSNYIRRLRKWLLGNGHKRLGYVWAREQAAAKSQHYHSVFMLNGNLNRHPYHLIEKAEYYWQEWDLGTVYTPENSYKLVNRDDEESFNFFYKRAAYLAKVGSKGKKALPSNDYSSSRIKVYQIQQIPRAREDAYGMLQSLTNKLG